MLLPHVLPNTNRTKLHSRAVAVAASAAAEQHSQHTCKLAAQCTSAQLAWPPHAAAPAAGAALLGAPPLSAQQQAVGREQDGGSGISDMPVDTGGVVGAVRGVVDLGQGGMYGSHCAASAALCCAGP